MKTFLISFVFALLSSAVFDGVWLSSTLKSFYSPRLAHLTASSPSYAPAVLFYIVYAVGVVLLVVLPAISGNFSLSKTFLYGALLGFVSYSAYDLTNQSTLRDWPVLVTVVDILWGSFMTGSASLISFYITKYFI